MVAILGLSGCGGGGGGSADRPSVTPTPDPEPPDTTADPTATRFRVEVASGTVTTAPSAESVGTSAVLAGTAVRFRTTKLVDEGGSVGVKATAVRIENHTGRDLTDARVVFSDITSLAGVPDIRSLVNVSTIASTLTARAIGVAVGLDGCVYYAGDYQVYKLEGGILTVLAGDGTAGYAEGVGTGARFNGVTGLAVNPTDGALIVAEDAGNRVRRIDQMGTTSLVAGTGVAGGTDGAGTVARFTGAMGVAVSSLGRIYIAETAGHRIREIRKTGGDAMSAASYTVSTLAGNGTAGYVDGVGTSARFSVPRGVAVDAGGNVYVADSGNRRIRMIRPAGHVTTIAGSGASGAADGSGEAATLASPYGVTVLPDTGRGVTVVFSDWIMRQIRLKADGTATPSSASSWVVQTLAGTSGVTGNTDGTGDVALFYGPRLLSADTSGNVYVADYANRRVRRVTPQNGLFPVGSIAGTPPVEPVRLANADGRFPFAGGNSRPYIDYGSVTGGGTSDVRSWAFAVPEGVTAFEFTVTVEGQADPYAPPEGVDGGASGGKGSERVLVRTLAGSPDGYMGLSNGTGPEARFSSINAIALDPEGNLFVADTQNNAIRRVTTDGQVNTIAGVRGAPGSTDGAGNVAQFSYPYGLAVVDSSALSGSNVWPPGTPGFYIAVADLLNYRIRLIRFPSAGWDSTQPWEPWNPAFYQVGTIAGDGTAGYINGLGNVARFARPMGVVAGTGGVLYVVEGFGANRIRRLEWLGGDPLQPQNWEVSLVAGSTTGESGFADAYGSAARFNEPSAAALGPDGELYVSDYANNRIRKVTPDGEVTTVAGAGGSAYLDGTGTAARFASPADITSTPDGYLYIAEYGNARIRRVTPGGVVTTVAGTGSTNYLDGRGDQASFGHIFSIVASPGGDLYVGDGARLCVVQRVVSVGDTTVADAR